MPVINIEYGSMPGGFEKKLKAFLEKELPGSRMTVGHPLTGSSVGGVIDAIDGLPSDARARVRAYCAQPVIAQRDKEIAIARSQARVLDSIRSGKQKGAQKSQPAKQEKKTERPRKRERTHLESAFDKCAAELKQFLSNVPDGTRVNGRFNPEAEGVTPQQRDHFGVLLKRKGELLSKIKANKPFPTPNKGGEVESQTETRGASGGAEVEGDSLDQPDSPSANTRSREGRMLVSPAKRPRESTPSGAIPKSGSRLWSK